MEKSSVPTGCYKCGRPGHWSRDCPDDTETGNKNPKTQNHNPIGNPPNPVARTPVGLGNNSNSYSNNRSGSIPPPKEKPKKIPRKRPKLTPDILLADDHGLPFILRHFPRHFKYRGSSHVVSDLGNLIGLYSEWHSRLLPYYSFPQFIHKVEQVAATKRVKMCIRGLRERVASGGDPAKPLESETDFAAPNVDPDHSTGGEVLNSQGHHREEDPFLENHDAEVQEDMLHEVYHRATDEPSLNPCSSAELQKQNNGTSSSSDVLITEEQRARMEANKQKALERAAARARSLQST
ncbi:hypothetical protein Tsubulata_038705 [Turnera subulata]|uniref:CCHC-type domain-containing protein n=2 Tax=Turnera subulata TaxID=218843 RepID=A0A9Q0F040_9ROSI|nr:hypothetical protein Tsubulata_038705 [Turnera subulata]